MKEGDNHDPCQLVLQLKDIAPPVGSRKILINGEDFLATDPVGLDYTGWRKDYWDFVHQEGLKKPPTFKEVLSPHTLCGRPIYLDLARDVERDEHLFWILNEIHSLGGGIILWIDQRDSYGENLNDNDLDYHYVLVGIDLGTFPGGFDIEGLWDRDGVESVWDDEEIRDFYAGITIPLPMLMERLGYVGFAELTTEEEMVEGTCQTALTLPFSEAVGVLKEMFDGRIRLGLRSDRDPLYSMSRPLGFRIEPTNETARALYEGPLVPSGSDDEERLAILKEWLLKVESDLGPFNSIRSLFSILQ